PPAAPSAYTTLFRSRRGLPRDARTLRQVRALPFVVADLAPADRHGAVRPRLVEHPAVRDLEVVLPRVRTALAHLFDPEDLRDPLQLGVPGLALGAPQCVEVPVVMLDEGRGLREVVCEGSLEVGRVALAVPGLQLLVHVLVDVGDQVRKLLDSAAGELVRRRLPRIPSGLHEDIGLPAVQGAELARVAGLASISLALDLAHCLSPIFQNPMTFSLFLLSQCRDGDSGSSSPITGPSSRW